jgi:hypothetical protein
MTESPSGWFAVFVGPNLISWCAKKQKTVSRSNTKAEYKAMADATAEVMWVQAVLNELRIPCPQSARLWCDNMGGGGQVPRFESNFSWKNETCWDWLSLWRDRVVQKLLNVRFIGMDDQLADGLCCRPRSTDGRWHATREPGGPEPLSIGLATRTRPDVEIRWACHLTYT